MLQNSIDFQYEIIRRRTEFDRKKAAERAHILEGLKVALDFIDEVIAIIRGSKTIAESKEALTERFGLDDIQTTAIVQMQLGKLAGLEKQKILDELKEKLDFIKECDAILASRERILDIVKTEALNVHILITFQLEKGSSVMRYYTQNNIGMAKNIVDVASTCIMIRDIFEDEYDGEKNALHVHRIEGNGSKIPQKLTKDKRYQVFFIVKNQEGAANAYQVVAEHDKSRNIIHEVGVTNISPDSF